MLRTSSRLFVACLLSLTLIACAEKHAADPRLEAPLVRTIAVQNAQAASRSFSGIVSARVQSDLGFRVSGKVLQRLVDTGETVKSGQPLMRIDPVDLSLEVHAQEAAVVAARAQTKQAENDEVRYRDLVATGAVSASAYDQYKTGADAARARLNAAQARADVARNTLTYATLLADANGVVVETLAEPGQVVSAGQVVVRLAHSGPREAIVQLPETLRPKVGSEGKAILYGDARESAPVTLRQLSDAADHLTRTYEARYVLGSALASAPLGATVTIELSDNEADETHSIQVPVSALFDPGKGTGVWVVASSPARVAWRPVTVIGISDEAAVVHGDLKPGDQIVSLGAQLLHDGQLVRLTDTDAHTAPSIAQGTPP